MITKSNIVDIVAEKTGFKKKDADAAVTAFIDAIAETLANGEKAQIVGLGSFEVKERAARSGRNPFTGEEIEIPATKHISFNAGKGLKDKVN